MRLAFPGHRDCFLFHYSGGCVMSSGRVPISDTQRFIYLYTCMHAKSLQSWLTLCDPMDCSPPGSSVYGILQTRILEWVAMPFSKGTSQFRDQTRVSGKFLTEPPGKPNITYNCWLDIFNVFMAFHQLTSFPLILSTLFSTQSPSLLHQKSSSC